MLTIYELSPFVLISLLNDQLAGLKKNSRLSFVFALLFVQAIDTTKKLKISVLIYLISVLIFIVKHQL